MKKLFFKIKNSFFVVNKLYLLLAFLYFFISDKSKAMYFLFALFIIYSIDIVTSKIPLNFDDGIEPITYNYKKTEDRTLKLDLWLPNTKEGSYPLVFFCHGGGWISGFRNQPNNVSWCKFFASNNIAAVSIDYRYGIKNSMEDILSDYDDALTFVRNNSQELKIDKNRIILMGLSAGAHLSLLYAAYFSNKKVEDKLEGIKGVVSYYGPSCLEDILLEDNKSLFARFALNKTLDMNREEQESHKIQIYRYYSPLSWIDESMLACCIAHGKLDNTVPFISSVKLSEELRNYSVDYKLLVHPTGDHSFDTELKDDKTKEIIEESLAFIKNKLEVD